MVHHAGNDVASGLVPDVVLRMDGTLCGDVAHLGLEHPAMFLLSDGTVTSDLAEQTWSLPKRVGRDGQKRDLLIRRSRMRL